jgi:putative serine protease PepD
MNEAVHHRRPRRRGWLIALAAIVTLAVGGVIGGLIVAANQTSDADVCAATTVANDVLPSVVTIEVRSGASSSTGSGEIIRSDGYILTNNHVISAAASSGSITVVFSDGSSESATLTGRDPQTDLAVIKVKAPEPLPAITFGDSSEIQVGQPVVVLGAPLGLSSTVTSGIVSALDRTIAVPGDNGQAALLVSAIQSDASINPGNSGGAMTDCAGDLIGVPSAGATVPNSSGGSSAGSVGLGFAIPVNLAKTVSDEIIATGTVTHSYLGIEVAQIPPAAAQQAGTPEGLYVTGVLPGGPSASAGLKKGDIITEIDGEPATDPNQLAAVQLTKKPGQTVDVTYERNGTSTSATITLAEQP